MKNGYDIKLIGNAMRNTSDDTSTSEGNLAHLTLKANGNTGANIYVEVTDGFTYGKIYARDTNSVNIHCHQGGNCNYIMVECPENSLNNSCNIFCDDDPSTGCGDMNIYSTNGYCMRVTMYGKCC